MLVSDRISFKMPCISSNLIIQVLFWIHNIFMILANTAPFPFLQRLKPDYPYNNLKGKLCSGYGLNSSRVTDRDQSMHFTLVIYVIIYLAQLSFFSFKTSRFLKKISQNGSGSALNKKFRYFHKFCGCNLLLPIYSGETFSVSKTLVLWW